MGQTKIEWTARYLPDGTTVPGYTFNPVMGCQKVSDGCKFCYAEEMMDHRYGKAKWGPMGTRVRTSAANWRKPVQWNKQAKAEGARYRVFCASLADVFEDHIDWVQPRLDLLRMIEQTPHLDWLLLTKRPENVVQLIEQAQEEAGAFPHARGWLARFSNVWIGTSVENQEAADKRIPHLLQIPAAVRFLSCEPLLGPADLTEYLPEECLDCDDYMRLHREEGAMIHDDPQIHWVIAGGESGPHARPMHPEWARSLRDQCQAAGVPFLFKQWGEWLPIGQDINHIIGMGQNQGKYRSSDAWRHLSDHNDAAKVGKHNAGRLLDGVEWNQFPDEVQP